MTTNSYFDSNYDALTQDQVLIEDLIIEGIHIYGRDIQYVPRTLVNFDDLYGEDQSSSFDDAYTVEMYIKSVDGFGGDGHFIAKFGLEIRDEVILTVSRKRFTEEVTSQDADITHPREGDLVTLPTTIDKRNRLFEITFVEEEEVYYQLGNLYTYEVRCKVWQPAGETMDTGVSEIDNYNDFALTRTLTMINGTGDYTVGETVRNIADETAEVVAWDNGSNQLTLVKIEGDYLPTEIITGDSSSVSYEIDSTETIINNDSKSDNDTIKTETNGLVDFSEDDPFGEL